MAENPPPSAASVKEKLKKSSEREVECASNLQLLRQDLLKAQTAAIDVVLTQQKAVVKLDEELEENAKDLENVHVHFVSERETLLSSYVGSLLRKERKKAASKPVSQSDAPRFVAPQHTPSILCFLRTHLGKPGMADQPGAIGVVGWSVAGHLKLADYPHPRHYAICDSPDHHQILYAPRRAYQEVIPE
ncbi:hypothetical protein OUZ56_033424 [Daphnia magna]|uniref:Uncharacterized protein n=1 Tax=Daphnia magna TaxID=35525 RepID=A0ABQ9ZXU4_9CRUS|nr:hypothetical protein OUZ56_033424 [Daphnia magna]